MPIIDSHIHVFEADSPTYPRDRSVPIQPDEPAPVEAYIEEMTRAGVDQAVLIHHICYGYDNRYTLDCVRRYPDKFCAVVMVDPLAADAAEQLRTLVVEHGARGLRLMPLLDPSSTWLNDPVTYPLWEVAAQQQISIGLILAPHQLPQAHEMIRRFPRTPVVIDHMGRPSPDSPPDAEPFRSMLALARYPNVYTKFSGFYAFSRQPYPYVDLTPHVRALWQAFGRERLMWATDYPLSVLAGESYAQSRDLLRFHLPELSAEDEDCLMGRTTQQLYRM